MDDKIASHVHNGKKTTSLLDLPDEMILHICSFIDTLTLHGLSLVCKRCNEILKKNTFMWKARINRIWPYISNPPLQPANPDELFWKRSCVAIEKLLHGKYSHWEKIFWDSQDRRIDALLLTHAGATCIASTRDLSLLYYKIPPKWRVSYESMFPTRIKFAHNQPICGLTAIDNTIYSCSLDQSVKSWMFINTGLVEQKIYELNVPGGLLCMSSCPERGLFATGSYRNGTIFVFDSRQDKPIMQYRPHTGAVIKLAMNSEYILSASEDKTVSVWDQRAGQTMKSFTISGEAYPTCVNMQRDWVCVGDSTAKLHLLDLKNDSELVKSYSTRHISRITGMHMTDGCLITAGSADRTVRFSSLTTLPQTIDSLYWPYEISSMDYLNDTLAVSSVRDIAVWRKEEIWYITVWRPKLTDSTKHQGTENFKKHFLDIL